MTPEQLTGQSDSHLVPTLIGTKSFLVHSDVIDDLNSLIEAAQLAGFKMEIASGHLLCLAHVAHGLLILVVRRRRIFANP